MKRRSFLQTLGAGAALAGCASIGGKASPQVVVIGGGYGGATAAKYMRAWVGSSRVDLQACKLEYSIVSPK